MTKHVLFRISVRGGPHPSYEMDKLFDLANLSDEHVAWFPSRKSGAGWKRPLPGTKSFALISYRLPSSNEVELLQAEILERRSEPPKDADALEMYENPTQYSAWWKLTGLTIRRMPVVDVPGVAASNKRSLAAQTNASSLFYWLLDPNLPSMVAQEAANPIKEIVETDLQMAVTEQIETLPADEATGSRRRTLPELVWDYRRPTCALHGVDFSGGAEQPTGNPKIWIAS